VYRAKPNGVVEACWLRQLLQELHAPLMKSTLISTNPIQHQHRKHVKIDLHFVQERMV
jgi:hypothetical protein